MKKKLKIKLFPDTKKHYHYNFLYKIISDEFDIVIDEDNPDYVIITANYLFQHIENELEYLYRNYDKYITIYFGTEAYIPDFNFFDYVIGYDDISFGDRYIRYTPLLDSQYLLNKKNMTMEKAKEILKSKKNFCNFIYRNPYSYYYRDEIFYKLSKYKFVHSLGEHLKNTDTDIEPRDGNWLEGSVDAKKDFKFSIAAENNLYKDAVTEKIITSMAAYTIPIYFGDTNISARLNTKSFVNCHDYDDITDVIKKIEEIDNNDNLWCEMMCEPWQTNLQKEKTQYELKLFTEGILNIFRQDIKKAKRISSGTMVDMGRNKTKKIFFSYRILVDNFLDTIAWWIPIRKWRNGWRLNIKNKIADWNTKLNINKK